MVKFLDYVIYWSIIFIPFSMATSPVPVSIFSGFLIVAYLVKQALKKEGIFPKTAINLPLLLFFLITCISIVNSINFRDTFKGGILRLLQYAFIFFIMAKEIKDKKHVRIIVFSVLVGLVLASIDGIFQVITGFDFIRHWAPIINMGLVRATASFKDSNTFGIYLSALAPLLLGLALYYYKGSKRMFFVLASVISVIGIYLTYSRPTLLAIYIVLFFLSIIRRDKIVIISLVVLTVISPFIAPKGVKDWAKQVDYDPIRFMCNDDRIAIFRNSMNMIKHNPILGVGANTFMKNYKKYKENPEYMNIVTSDYLYAHNNFLQLTAELGFIGLAVFLWLLYKLFSESVAIYRKLKDDYLRIVSLSLIACLIAFLINGLTESSLNSSRVALIFWYLCGFSLSLKNFIKSEK
ncbi:MAG: O-antigen ligase family protein [Candidatus Omnitrophica bacterium]|nr:O-antigen ligase family protein [Candidatus Omnitrophota bacterium]